MSESASELTREELHIKAHEWSQAEGVKAGQPKRSISKDQPISEITKEPESTIIAENAVAGFNASKPRKILEGKLAGEFDTPNQDFVLKEDPRIKALDKRMKKALSGGRYSEAIGLRKQMNLLAEDDYYTKLPSLDYSPTLLREAGSVQEVTERGQVLHRVILNEGALSDHPKTAASIYFGLYGNVIDSDDESRLRLLELAKQMPKRALISFDYPGYGGSESMLPDQKSTSEENSYYSIARNQLSILKKMGIERINAFGISQGGFAAITLASLASEYDIQVDNVIAIGTPGIEKTNLAALGVREGLEMRSLDYKHSSPANPDMYRVTHAPDGKKVTPPNPIRDDKALRYARMMTRETIPARAVNILRTQDELYARLHGTSAIESNGQSPSDIQKIGDIRTRLLFINGSEDTVSRETDVAAMVKQLQSEFDSNRVARIVQMGEGHLAMIHPKELAPVVRSQIEGRFI